jgi:FtsH-binding integral membrane protein
MYALAYGGDLIWMAFGTAGLVSGTALAYGTLTKSDLTGLGRMLNFALMALIGITLLWFVASFFTTLTFMHLFICYFGLAIFVGLTAYEAQQIRSMSAQLQGTSSATMGKYSLLMALRMYINVIMVCWYILQIFASNRD